MRTEPINLGSAVAQTQSFLTCHYCEATHQSVIARSQLTHRVIERLCASGVFLIFPICPKCFNQRAHNACQKSDALSILSQQVHKIIVGKAIKRDMRLALQSAEEARGCWELYDLMVAHFEHDMKQAELLPEKVKLARGVNLRKRALRLSRILRDLSGKSRHIGKYVSLNYKRDRYAANLFISRPSVRNALMQEYEFRCVNCKSSENLQIDHIVSVLKGGPSAMENLQVLCRSCNASKGKH